MMFVNYRKTLFLRGLREASIQADKREGGRIVVACNESGGELKGIRRTQDMHQQESFGYSSDFRRRQHFSPSGGKIIQCHPDIMPIRLRKNLLTAQTRQRGKTFGAAGPPGDDVGILAEHLFHGGGKTFASQQGDKRR